MNLGIEIRLNRIYNGYSQIYKGEDLSNKLQISLAAARVNAELSQKEVADCLNISKTTLVNWEKGRSSPEVEQAMALSQLYKMPLENIRFRK